MRQTLSSFFHKNVIFTVATNARVIVAAVNKNGSAKTWTKIMSVKRFDHITAFQA
jgi:hypothetical protein